MKADYLFQGKLLGWMGNLLILLAPFHNHGSALDSLNDLGYDSSISKFARCNEESTIYHDFRHIGIIVNLV